MSIQWPSSAFQLRALRQAISAGIWSSDLQARFALKYGSAYFFLYNRYPIPNFTYFCLPANGDFSEVSTSSIRIPQDSAVSYSCYFI